MKSCLAQELSIVIGSSGWGIVNCISTDCSELAQLGRYPATVISTAESSPGRQLPA